MCGVFGVVGHPEAANIAYLGLHALQHRGQESCGIAAARGEELTVHRAMGLVGAAFTPAELERLPGDAAIGHVRYSTAGGNHLMNAQPIAVDFALGSLAMAHNGNLTNYEALRQRLEGHGSIFQSRTDSEAIVHLIAMSRAKTVHERVLDALRSVEGAYSLVFLADQSIIAVRDPMGFRPLCLGMLPISGSKSAGAAPRAYVVASEPTAFDLIGAEFLRDVDPGEMVALARSGITSSRPFEARPRRTCLFEYVYFARPDSRIDGIGVYDVRKRAGARVFDEHPVEGAHAADTVVVPVPDSGVPAAIGLAAHAGLPFEMGLIRSHYVGRTFIEPSQSIRHFGVRLKLNPNASVLRDKRVIVVDDSIVRGTTSRKLVRMLRAAGAREVHVRISSPPTEWPCYYGIDTPTRGELIAASHSVDEIRRYLSADSLGYLSLDGLLAAVRGAHPAEGGPAGRQRDAHCHACFSGEYPIPFGKAERQLRLIHG